MTKKEKVEKKVKKVKVKKVVVKKAKKGRQGDGGGTPPRVLTDKEKEYVGEFASVLTVAQMADYLGIGRQTFYDILARDEEVDRLYKKGRARVIGDVAGNLINQAQSGNTSAAIFYLKTQAGWKDQTQLVIDKPIGIVDLTNKTPEEAAAFYKQKILEDIDENQ